MNNTDSGVVAITQLVSLYGLAVDSQRWELFDRIFGTDVDRQSARQRDHRRGGVRPGRCCGAKPTPAASGYSVPWPGDGLGWRSEQSA
jgi:hypothetical protein